MASKDSVRFLAQSIGGLGDRLRQSAQDQMANTRAEAGLSMQNRYAGLAENRANEDVKMKRKADAKQRFVETMTILAAPLARAAKSDNPSMFFDQVAAEALKSLSPEDQALVGMDGQYGQKPSQKQFTEAYPTGPFGTKRPPSLGDRLGGAALDVGNAAINPVNAIMSLRKRFGR